MVLVVEASNAPPTIAPISAAHSCVAQLDGAPIGEFRACFVLIVCRGVNLRI